MFVAALRQHVWKCGKSDRSHCCYVLRRTEWRGCGPHINCFIPGPYDMNADQADVPNIPSVPEFPDTPTQPELPNAPTEPEFPNLPVQPEFPSNPMQPEIPAHP